MIQNLIFAFFFFLKYYISHATLIYLSTHSSGHQSFFLNFTFSGRKSQSQQKLAKKVTYFKIQFHSKNVIRFMNLNSIDI